MSSSDPSTVPAPQPPPDPAERRADESIGSAAQVPPPGPAPQTGAPIARAPQPGAQPVRLPAPQSSFKQPFAKGFGAGLGLTVGAGAVALVLTVVSLLGMGLISRTLGNVATSAQNSLSHVWGPANASNTLLAINISGVIDNTGSATLYSSATYGYEIADQLDALKADDYAGVVLLMDTPGGSISGSRAIADAIVRYQERTGKKVVAYVQAMAASGGMYAMAPADLIISDHGTLIGSIGVIMGPFEYYRDVTGLTGNILTSGVITTGGITHEYLTQGTGKDFGNPFREMSEQERATYTNGIGIEYQAFVDYVAQHRGIPADRIVNELGAYLFDPQTVVDKGLVDEIMGRPDGFLRAAEVSGVDPSDTKIVSPAMPSGLAQLFGVQARIYGHNVPLSTVDGSTPTSSICVGSPTVLAFAGDFTSVCGG